MFWNNFKYGFLKTMRQKETIIWIILFPMALATFFNMAFMSIYDSSEKFETIPAAVAETEKYEAFTKVLDEISNSDEPLFSIEYVTYEKAQKMLREEEIKVIFKTTADDVDIEVKNDGITMTIASYFVSQYKAQEAVILDTMQNHPEKLGTVIETFMSDGAELNENIPLTSGNMNPYIQYFYNLLAMVCLYGALTGLAIATDSQANLSPIGARRCCSPTNKLVSVTAEVLAKYIAQVLCISVSVTYIIFVLKVDMGDRIHMVYLSSAIGSLVGITMGFFVGSIGRMSESVKVAVIMTVSMSASFLSGLMIGNMKAVLAKRAPIVNELNPAAMISDMFYCLNIYTDYERYTEKVISILILSAVFTIGGYFMTRRKKYASL